jgi:hypothetical protein
LPDFAGLCRVGFDFQMGSFGKNAFATVRLTTYKQGMADFQRTLNPRLTGIYHHVTSPFTCDTVISQFKT